MSLTFSALAQHEQYMASAYMSPPQLPNLTTIPLRNVRTIRCPICSTTDGIATSRQVKFGSKPARADQQKGLLGKLPSKGYSKGACLKPSPFNPLPANNTFGVPEGMAYRGQEVYQGVGAYYHPQTVPLSPEAAMFSPVYTGSASPVPAWGYGEAGYYAHAYGNPFFY
ncbi:hypothetical protein NXS19_006097 [Fusarium pseudograminearum]|nr:hypothetical protein NXS19_006097 [Fusarium pseudograminearum]